ncbi:MAG: hypothetical protein JNJ83_13060 [Verrucomicrobiaceae bacterium]|nr:hypothetical protein [Verrucomicrobiaceae bacterium]
MNEIHGIRVVLGVSLLGWAGAIAQVVPTTPTKFGNRAIGGNGGAAVGLVTPPKPEPVVRMVSYISLSQPRQWTSNDGKPIIAKLIAFEDMVVETTKAAAANERPQMPKLPGKPTVVKDGKVRLLKEKQPFEVPLDRLSAADREYVEKLKAAVAK